METNTGSRRQDASLRRVYEKLMLLHEQGANQSILGHMFLSELCREIDATGGILLVCEKPDLRSGYFEYAQFFDRESEKVWIMETGLDPFCKDFRPYVLERNPFDLSKSLVHNSELLNSLGSVRHKAVVVPIVFEDSRLGLVCLTFDDRVRPLLHFCQRMRPYFSLFARCLAQNQFPNLHDAWTEKKAEDGVALKALPHVSNPVFVCDQRMRVCHLNPASEVLFTTSEQEA
ncbi:hypothetical protein, partial [Oleiphilus sp. HI0080]|uniref:hypothetical protein n=1 Tax=Oleiphilus sp. HI0080 TaxID=1822255 RepID=UPI0012E7B9BE